MIYLAGLRKWKVVFGRSYKDGTAMDRSKWGAMITYVLKGLLKIERLFYLILMKFFGGWGVCFLILCLAFGRHP